MGETIDAMDRISELPDHIIHHIMSYLSPKEVAETIILSKRWKHLRTSFPILEFDQSLRETADLYSFRMLTKIFVKFVDVSVTRFCDLKFPMQKFSLSMRLLDDDDDEDDDDDYDDDDDDDDEEEQESSSSFVDKWIALSVENQVKEMDIDIVNSTYMLTSAIFSARFLTTLKLTCCEMKQPTDAIRLDSLRKLTLAEVELDEEMVRKVASECPSLEEVFFDTCDGINCYRVSNPKLKIVQIDGNLDEVESVEIDCPNLEKFGLDGYYGNAMSRIINVDMARSQHLKELHFYSVTLTSQQFHHLISQFPLLEDLRVRYCCFLETVTISSDRLKKLEVSDCLKVKVIDVDTPNLLSFCFANGSVPHSSINAPCPWRVFFEGIDRPVAAWYITLREFLGQSNQIELLSLSFQEIEKRSFGKIENSFNLEQVRESFHSLPSEIGNLRLCPYLQPVNYSTWLDGFLWLCFPKTLTLSTPQSGCHGYIEGTYKELKSRRTNCCDSERIKCWRHYLKDLKIGKFERSSEGLLDVANLTDAEPWPYLPSGRMTFHLDWSYDELN